MICKNRFYTFFKDHPSLLPSLFFLLGLTFAVKGGLALYIPLLVFSLPTIRYPKRLFFLYSIAITAFFYGKYTDVHFPSNLTSFTGTAIFSVSEIKTEQSHFKKTTSLRGTIVSMEGNLGEKAHNIPCFFPISPSLRPLKCKTYQIEGTLEKNEKYFSFTPKKDTAWKERNGDFCFPEWRFKVKEKLKKSIEKKYPNSLVSDFIIALTLGDLDNRLLRFSFGKLGLQHILAISGFHFSLLSLFIGRFLKLFFKEKTAIVLLLFFLTCYFFLLHQAPSILRAYFAITLYLIGRLLGYRPNALNLLGVTLLIELTLHPQSVKNLGFQLSFLATASILLLYPFTFSLMTKLLPKRSHLEALSLHPIEKIMYLFCSFLRSTFAVNLAVSTTLIPTCLWYFSTFPIASLLYNIFVPFTVFISLFLFLLAIPLGITIPPVSHLIDQLNEAFTGKILNLLIESPNCLGTSLSFPYISEPLLYFYLLLIFSFAILAKTKKKSVEIIQSPRSNFKELLG